MFFEKTFQKFSEKRFQKKLKRIKKHGERMKKEKKIRDAYSEYLPDSKKKKVSNIMLCVIVVAIVGYVVADFVLQYRMGIEISSTITTCWFAFWGTEIIALTGIKMSKVKHKTSDVLDTVPDSKNVLDEEACG